MQSISIRVTPNFTLIRQDAVTGQVLEEIKTHNLVPKAGLNLIRDFLRGYTKLGLKYFAIGTGTTPAAAADTKLQTEKVRDVFTQVDVQDGKLTFKYYLSATQGNGLTYTEAGLFGDTATGTADTGILAARATFAASPKTTAEAWTFVWDYTIADDGV